MCYGLLQWLQIQAIITLMLFYRISWKNCWRLVRSYYPSALSNNLCSRASRKQSKLCFPGQTKSRKLLEGEQDKAQERSNFFLSLSNYSYSVLSPSSFVGPFFPPFTSFCDKWTSENTQFSLTLGNKEGLFFLNLWKTLLVEHLTTKI